MSQLTGPDSSSLVFAQARGAALPVRVADYVAMTKPRITVMVVVTAAIGFAFAASTVGDWSWWLLCGTLAGTALSCMGASALNQTYERDTDALMHRTRLRPMPAGRLSMTEGIGIGLFCGIAGVALLWAAGSALAAALSAATIFSYTLIYTPLKRLSPSALLVGAIPGAMPPMIGYAAVDGTLGAAAWVLFGIMFLWQVPHFLAIAWLYREDYARAGFPLLPVLDPTGRRTFHQTLVGCVLLLPVGLLPTMLGLSGLWYFFAALACGVGFLGFAIALVIRPSRSRARRLFLVSLLYLPAVLMVMVIDKL